MAKKAAPNITTEELVVGLLQHIVEQLSHNHARRIPIVSLHANGKLGQLPGVVDDTIIEGDIYRPDRNAVEMFYMESSGDVWVYEHGRLATVVPGNSIGNIMIDPSFQLDVDEGKSEESTDEQGPSHGALTSDATAEELAQTVLNQAG